MPQRMGRNYTFVSSPAVLSCFHPGGYDVAPLDPNAKRLPGWQI